MHPLEVLETGIADVFLIRPKLIGDARGYFMEVWHRAALAEAGLDIPLLQVNQSRSVRHTLRGLHYQRPQSQGKLVRAVSGEVFDVAVDLRRSSAGFGRWIGCTLSAENREQLWIPPGFAHGFLVLSETAEVEYGCTEYHAPEFERVIAWNDPDLGIEWPLPPDAAPVLSERDHSGVAFRAAETFP